MKPRHLLPVSLLLAACSSGSDDPVSQTPGASVAGEWVGTISETSVIDWTLDESTSGGERVVSGSGTIRSSVCATEVALEGTRTGDELSLVLTLPSEPSALVSIEGAVDADGAWESVFFVEQGAPVLGCLTEPGGVVSAGRRNPDGLNGRFEGTWTPVGGFAGAPTLTVHLVQTGDDVFGAVTWFDYACSSGGFLSGVLEGDAFLANVRPPDPDDAFHFLEATWDPATGALAGASTLLGPGPGPGCFVNAEESFALQEQRGAPQLASEPRLEPEALLLRRGPDGRRRVEGVFLRR